MVALVEAIPAAVLRLISYTVTAFVLFFPVGPAVVSQNKVVSAMGLLLFIVALLMLACGALTFIALPIRLAREAQLERLEKRRRDHEQVSLGLAGRAAHLGNLIDNAQALLNDLQNEMSVRVVRLQVLQAQQEEQLRGIADLERLQELRREQARAVTTFVEETIERAHRKLDKGTSRQQLGYFVAGLLVAVPTGLLGNLLYEKIS